MKKKILIMIIALSMAISSGCGFVSQEKYDSLNDELESTEKKLSKTEKKLEDLQEEYDSCKEELAKYQEAEVNEQEELQEEAGIQTVPEDVSGYETGITYEQLARTPDDYIGSLVKFTGEVIQVMDGEEEINIRLAVDGDYNNILFCGYETDIVSSRVLENDTITIYGMSYGLYSYESTLGGQITVPAVWVDKIEQ